MKWASRSAYPPPYEEVQVDEIAARRSRTWAAVCVMERALLLLAGDARQIREALQAAGKRM